MARYAIEDTTLTAIGDAVREKTGELTKIVYNKNSDIFTVELPITKNITHNFPVSKVRTVVIRIKEESFAGVSYYLINLNTNAQTRITFLDNNDSNFDWIKEATISLEDNEYALDINNMWKDGYTATVELIYYDINNELIKAPEEVKNTMIPREMAEKINKLNHLPDEMLNITGDCQYRFAIGGWDWFINLYGNKITTSDISNALNMFYNSEKIETIPFEINFDKSSTYHNLQDMFNGSSKLKEIPKINNVIPYNTGNIFRGCASIRYLPEDIEE